MYARQYAMRAKWVWCVCVYKDEEQEHLDLDLQKLEIWFFKHEPVQFRECKVNAIVFKTHEPFYVYNNNWIQLASIHSSVA